MIEQARWLAGAALAAAMGFSPCLAAPEPPGVLQAHNPTTGADTALERSTPIEWVRLRSLSGGGGSSYLEISGARSPVRFKAGPAIVLVSHGGSLSADAAAGLKLYAMGIRGDARQLDLAEVGATGPKGWQVAPSRGLPLTARTSGDVLTLAPAAALAPGEYCLDDHASHDGLCFGVDP